MMNKLKKLDIKQVIKSFTLIWGLITIVVMTITNLGIKKEFDFFQWLSNSLILLGIMVFGLLMGESIGGDKQKEKVNGLYQTSLNEYNVFRSKVDNLLPYFNQFYNWFVKRELEDKKINYLLANDVDELKARSIVKYCDVNDYPEMIKHAIKKDDVIIRMLTDNELEPVYDVLSGKLKLDLCNPSYYLSAFALSTTKSVLEVGKQLDKEIKFNKKTNRSVKIIFSLIVSLGLGILTVNEFMSGSDSQAWVNLIARITSLFTSIFSGWLSSVIDVKLRAEKIKNKTTVLKMFKSSVDMKIFIPKTDQELAKEEYENYLKEEEEKRNNVITPEVINLPEIGSCETKLIK